mmetsp:Transcript_6024/g.21105  ORF Transcript_6024/g.21105 Transcript_6024/m.21105 type:complete len:204 (-) Transcript_6024:1116-1727(-)
MMGPHDMRMLKSISLRPTGSGWLTLTCTPSSDICVRNAILSQPSGRATMRFSWAVYGSISRLRRAPNCLAYTWSVPWNSVENGSLFGRPILSPAAFPSSAGRSPRFSHTGYRRMCLSPALSVYAKSKCMSPPRVAFFWLSTNADGCTTLNRATFLPCAWFRDLIAPSFFSFWKWLRDTSAQCDALERDFSRGVCLRMLRWSPL